MRMWNKRPKEPVDFINNLGRSLKFLCEGGGVRVLALPSASVFIERNCTGRGIVVLLSSYEETWRCSLSLDLKVAYSCLTLD